MKAYCNFVFDVKIRCRMETINKSTEPTNPHTKDAMMIINTSDFILF